MRTYGLFLVLLFSSVPAVAQLPYTAYPVDALHGQFGHWTTFGALSTGNSDESRSQHLILAPFLPCVPSRIYALEVSPHQTGSVPYESLRISMGHTTASALDPDFEFNLPAPTMVYSVTNIKIDWNSSARWFSFDLQTPFWYDGSSNLIIQVQKVVDRPANPGVPHITHQMSHLPQRRDLPRPVFKDGGYQSGASTDRNGAIYIGPPMLMRLTWVAPPTLTIESTRNGNEAWFRLGSTVGLHTRGQAGSEFVTFVDGALAQQPLSTTPIIGGGYWLWPRRYLVLGAGVVGANGVGDLFVQLPTERELVDLHLYFQSLMVGKWLSSVSWTNVADAIVAQ